MAKWYNIYSKIYNNIYSKIYFWLESGEGSGDGALPHPQTPPLHPTNIPHAG